MPEYNWQVPMRAQHPTQEWICHIFEKSKRTDKMVKTVCGIYEVNPGFAVPEELIPLQKKYHRCKNCEKRSISSLTRKP